ncbi:DUF2752 domain-containing protein [Streptomyces sp. NPDC058632]|uniref:DUF2752 domain-containing protein n=1 Tax=unclassified Streptomyces TaxID=2593676 RepID=UPI003649C8F0
MADAAPQAPSRGHPRWHPAVAPVAVLAAGAAGAAYLWGADPHEPGHLLPRCPLRAVTGLLCPACGGTRMAYDLMHGQFAAAWLDNRALLLAAPFALALWGRWTLEGLRGRAWAPRIAPWAQVLILATAVAWTVARNAV